MRLNLKRIKPAARGDVKNAKDDRTPPGHGPAHGLCFLLDLMRMLT